MPKLKTFFLRQPKPQLDAIGPPLPPSPKPISTTVTIDALGSDRFEYGTPLATTLTLPLAFASAWLIDSTSWAGLVRNVLVNMWLHEWSHALVAWLTGRIAVPLPFITIQFSEGRSIVVVVLVLALLGALFVTGRREKLPFLEYLAAGMILLTLTLTLGFPSSLTLEWVVFAGCAGEFVLGALLVSSFYFRLPDRLRWDAWRFPAAFYGAYGMVAAFRDWRESHLALTNMHWGSALGGRSDMSGDLNRLVYQYDFSAQEVADTYYYLGLSCLTAVWSLYGYFAVKIIIRHPAWIQRFTGRLRL